VRQPGSMASAIVGRALEVEVSEAREALERLARTRVDEEAVHDLRVAVRRMRSLLRASRGLYRRKTTERLERALRAVGQATSRLRDEEVLPETLEATKLTPTVRPRIDAWLVARRPRLIALCREGLVTLREASIDETLDGVLELVAAPRRDVEAIAFGRDRMLVERSELVALALRVKPDDIEELHQLRIHFKRLRYVADMLGGERHEGPRLPDAAAHTEIAAHAATFQKELGLVHDIDVARGVMLAAAELHHATRASVNRALQRRRLVIASACLDRLRLEMGQLVMAR